MDIESKDAIKPQPKSSGAEVAIGIDLGTTNSVVSVMEASGPSVIANKSGYKITPSVFAVTQDNRKLVGQLAKRQMLTNPENTIYATKRLIGRRFDSPEIKRALQTYPYKIEPGPKDDVLILCGGQKFTLQEVASLILLEMKRIAEEYLEHSIDKAVVTVPAFFNDAQRQGTKDAGTIAGLDVIRIINEPTAAALAYGFSKKNEGTIAVYDLGGGTFDISILEIGMGVFEVISTAGDTFLGGEDFDRRLIDFFLEDFRKQHNLDLSGDRMALQRFKDQAEKSKIELSDSEVSNASMPFIATGPDGPIHYNGTITRSAFEEMCMDLVQRTLDISKKTLEQSQIGQVDDVILVGGQTRMPLVQKRVAEYFGKMPRKGVHPDEVVAIGAAIQGHTLLNAGSEVLLLDVTPFSLGVTTQGGYFKVIIESNTRVPCKRSHIFTTTSDNQRHVKITVSQGESERAEENQLLGEFILDGIREAKRGEPEIEVTFDINADGIVSVSAIDLDTGKEQSITVTATTGLSPEELTKLKNQTENYAIELKS